MPKLYKKIKDPGADIKSFNDNFDEIALDLAARSGRFSSTASIDITVAAGETASGQINVLDNLELYERGQLPVIVRMDAFLDTDDDFTRYFPLGSAITNAELHGVSIDIYEAKSIIDEVTNEKATVVVIIRNDDSSSHDFYINLDAYYVPGPDKGAAAR